MSKSWPMVKLGEVLRHTPRPVSVKADESYRQIGIRSHGKGVFHKEAVSGFDLGNKKVFWMEPGDFVINIVFGWEGAVAVLGESEKDMIASHRFPTFRADDSRLDSRFLLYFCKTPAGLDLLGRVSPGGAGRNRTLSKTAFLEQSIPLPPLTEQRRIVARIEELAAQVHEAKRLRKEAAEEAEAMLASIIARMFNPKNDWKIKAISEFCEAPQYGYTESATRDAVGPKFLRITDIQEGNVEWATVPYCRCEKPDKYLLQANDLVFARTGATTGKSYVIKECPIAVFASYLIRLRVRDSVSIDYLYRYFQSPDYWMQIADEKKGTGQPNLNGSKLAALNIPIAPLPEQRRIVAELDALQAEVDALKRLQAATSAEIDALLPSILDRAFCGEL